MTQMNELEPNVKDKRRWTLSKKDLIRMLMAMDRYDVESVVLRDETDYLNWEIPSLRKK
jgi:hypothetical protein